VCAHSNQIAEMLAKSSNIGTRLAADPEHSKLSLTIELNEPAIVDGADTELSFDCRDKRRALEDGCGAQLKGTRKLRFAAWDFVVEANNGNVFLARTLLRLDQPRGAIDAHDQTACDFGIKSAAVARLLNTEDALDPRYNFMRGRIGGFVEVDYAEPNILFDFALQWCAAVGYWSEMTSPNEHCSRS